MSQAHASIAVTDEAWEVLQGAYDLHVHVAPDIIERRIDDIDLAKEFLSKGLKGFMLKSHYLPTTERAKVVAKAVPGAAVYGSVALNHSVGGLNPVAVEIAGRGGCKLIWMPTVDAANETAGKADGPTDKLPFWAKIQRELELTGVNPPAMTVIDDDGNLTKVARQCMEPIAKYNMVLATGHLGGREISALVRGAKDIGVRKVVVTHAEFPSQNLSSVQQRELADMGAIIEHCFTTMYTGKASWDVVFESIREVGPSRCLLSTDLGQTINPAVSEGFAMFVQKLLDAGFKAEEVRHMVVTNPEALMS